jgi:putative FmdB family regulatory protein
MPTYDYECRDCKHAFEASQRITEDSLKTCPVCKKDELRRLIGTGGALMFKGPGFYCTDYPRPPKVEPKKSD